MHFFIRNVFSVFYHFYGYIFFINTGNADDSGFITDSTTLLVVIVSLTVVIALLFIVILMLIYFFNRRMKLTTKL